MHDPIVNMMLTGLEILELFIVFYFHVLCIFAPLLWTGVIVIETARVRGASDFGDDRTFGSSVIEIVPVYGLEKWMGFDLLRSIRCISQTVYNIGPAHPFDEIACIS